MDKVFIRQLEIQTHIGVHAWEHHIRRPLLLDLDLGIDTREAGKDAGYLESDMQNAATDKARQEALARSQEEARTAATEHEKAMGLLAAARAEELRAQATHAVAQGEIDHRVAGSGHSFSPVAATCRRVLPKF